jgi:hypothetical protein
LGEHSLASIAHPLLHQHKTRPEKRVFVFRLHGLLGGAKRIGDGHFFRQPVVWSEQHHEVGIPCKRGYCQSRLVLLSGGRRAVEKHLGKGNGLAFGVLLADLAVLDFLLSKHRRDGQKNEGKRAGWGFHGRVLLLFLSMSAKKIKFLIVIYSALILIVK